jgi:hypothetical protein
VSAIPAYQCCCPTEPPIYPAEYYVFSVCPDPCCPLDCADSVDVKWCPSYAVAQGLVVPIVLTPGLCIKMTLGCCTYVMTAVIANPGGVCPTGGGVWNQGTYAGTRTIDPEEEGCCDAVIIDPPDNCLTEAAYVDPLVGNACFAYVFEPYALDDQWGTVPSKPVTVRSNLTYCYATFGANWDQRCDNCPPIDYYQSTVKASQEIGYCIPTDPISSCLGQRTYSQTVTLDCQQCYPCGDCCGNGDPCFPPSDPPITCDDPKGTWSVRTCYAVNPCLDENDDFTWFEQDVLTVTYDFCATAVDPDDPGALAALEALFAGGDVVTPWSALTVWGAPDTGIRISLCPGAVFSDPSVFVFSGNAKHIADAINSLTVNTPFLSAEADEEWGDCFWFGVRQTCDECPEDPPGTRPAFRAEGDELVFDRCEIISATKFKAIFRGRSKKHYVCASQTLISTYSVSGNCVGSSTDVINLAISATGDDDEGYALHCLSPAEYACGERYEMRQVEQEYCDTTICTAGNPTLTVPQCDAVSGYPLLDVVVEGVTVLEGWQSLCGGGLGGLPSISQIKCRSYPFVYEVLGCEDPFYGGLCTPGVYQQADRFCETFATPIQVL